MTSDRASTVSLSLLAIIASMAVLYVLKPILLPFIIAVMVSYLLSPLVEKMVSFRVPRIVTLLVVIALAISLLANVAETLVSNAVSFLQSFPDYQDELLDLFEQYSSQYAWLDQAVSQATTWLFSLPIGSFTNSVLNSSVNLLSNTFLVLLFVIYLCLSTPLLAQKIRRAFPGDQGKHIQKILNHINQDIRKYISLHTGVSLATGITVGIVCWSFSVPFWFLWGFMAFILNYIPTIGSIIATLPPVITAAVVLGITPAVWVGILVIAGQTFWGNIVEPKIAGNSLGLSPLVILLSLVFWGWLWGVVGAILAVPIAVILKVTCLNVPALRPVGILMDDQ